MPYYKHNFVQGEIITSQAFNEIDAQLEANTDAIEAMGGGTTTLSDYVVDSGTSTDGTIWYRKWKSGWLEQGGNLPASSSNSYNIRVNFVKNYNDANYIVAGAVVSTAAAANSSTNSTYTGVLNRTFGVNRKDTSGFYVNMVGDNGSGTGGRSWYACGQGGADE